MANQFSFFHSKHFLIQDHPHAIQSDKLFYCFYIFLIKKTENISVSVEFDIYLFQTLIL
jgi:hypothetical protein